MLRLALLPFLLLSFVFAPAALAQRIACENGTASQYGCEQVDLLGHLAINEMGGAGSTSGNDIWGWTDPTTGKEYALVGLTNGTSFVDVSDPESPVYLGRLPTHTSNSTWRDIKVYADYAFIVSEADGHGMQVFDLTRLRDVTSPQTFTSDAHYGQFGNAHNIVINEDSGFAYAVGTNQCSGGLHMVDITDPLSPSYAGCFGSDGYTHDAQCVIYDGPDTEHQGKEICFTAQGGWWSNHFGIVDVTNKANPTLIAQGLYTNTGYAHQGWLTEDHRYFIANDELDEGNYGHNTRTLIFDVSDLDDPEFLAPFLHPVASTDHNLYVKGDYAYLSNYTSGLRILDLENLLNGGESPELFGYFDTYPSSNSSQMTGSWSNYPFFESGNVIVNDIVNGLFVVEPLFETDPPVSTETAVPGSFVLTAAYPNPFTDRTQFTLRVADTQAVQIAVYDVLGRRVADLFDGTLAADEERTVTFDAAGMPAGTYLVRVAGESFAETRQVTLTR